MTPAPRPLAGAGLALAAGLALLAAGPVLARWPLAADRALLLALRAHASPGLTAAAVRVTALGSPPVLAAWVVAAALALAAGGRCRAAAAAVLACASVAPVVGLLKWAVARPRPALVPHLVAAGHPSFPSGHAAGSMAVYLTLALLAGRGRPVWSAPAVLLAGLVGASRVYLGVHWPSDVAAGWLLGAGWALAWRVGAGAA